MAPHEYEALSREERLRRIGALFYKAVVISLARKQALAEEAGGDSPDGTAILAADSLSEEDFAPLRRYAGPGEIAPRDATEFWGVCRTTAYRRIVELGTGRLDREAWDRYGHPLHVHQQSRALLEQDEQAKQDLDNSRARR